MDYVPATVEDVRPFLQGPHRAVLSTVGSGGAPHLVVVDYLVDDASLVVNGRASRRWVLNLRRDPRASALVCDPADVSHWVRISGTAELVRDGDDRAVEDARVMARRYGDDPEQFTGQHRVTWRLVPRQILERAC